MIFIRWWWKPQVCYKPFYKLVKFEKPSDCCCMFRCKYPPPSNMAHVYVGNNNNNNMRINTNNQIID